MHWEKHPNARLRSLAMDNAMTYMPEVFEENSWGELPRYEGELNLTFGSTGASIHLGVFDGDAEGVFMHGYCVLLALAIAEKRGSDTFVLLTKPGCEEWQGHVAVLADDDVIDFRGRRSRGDLAAEYPSMDVELVDRLRLLEVTVDREYRADPMGFLDELEALVTADFAERIVASAR